MINVYICVKQVPDSKTIETDPLTGSLIRESAGSVPNPADNDAISLLSQMQNNCPEIISAAITMGPKQARASLREALALGAMSAYHLDDPALGGSDSYITAYALSQTIMHIGKADYVICGEKSSDSDTGQVPGAIAEFLGFSCYYGIIEFIEIDAKSKSMIAVRENEGIRQTIQISSPAVLVPKSGAFPKLYSSMREKNAARKKDIIKISVSDLADSNPDSYGYNASLTKIHAMVAAAPKRSAKIIDSEYTDFIRELLCSENDESGNAIALSKAKCTDSKDLADGVFAAVHLGDTHITSELIGALQSEINASKVTVLCNEHYANDVKLIANEVIAFSSAGSSADDLLLEGVIDYIEEISPDAVLFPANVRGRWLSSKIAVRLKLGLTASCTGFIWEDNKLIQIRPAFEDRLMTAIYSTKKPALATVREEMFPEAKKADTEGKIIKKQVLAKYSEKYKIISEEAVKPAEKQFSDKVLVIGNAVSSKTDFDKLVKWAEDNEMTWGVTRPLIQGGLAPFEKQIGVSGTAVKAKLAILLGVSGSRKTMAGLRLVNTLLAINEDPDAEVFSQVDYGIIGDYKQILKG
ncbi:MAG: hypothetical protein GX684_02420 [Ruminococcaceae bacterium]|nr:hypothetical protein [Oscillospiraceae bacterium]